MLFRLQRTKTVLKISRSLAIPHDRNVLCGQSDLDEERLPFFFEISIGDGTLVGRQNFFSIQQLTQMEDFLSYLRLPFSERRT